MTLRWPLVRSLTLTSLISRAIGIVVLWPLAGVILRTTLATQGNRAVTDLEVARLMLHPTAAVGILVWLSIGIAISVMEQAALQLICLAGTRGTCLPAITATKFAWQHAADILTLSLRLLIRATLMTLPAVAAGGLVAWLLIADHDINFYLAERPLRFWCAAALLVTITGVWCAVAVPRFLGWIHVLPLLLAEPISGRELFRVSTARATGRRSTVLVRLMLWMAALVVTSLLMTAAMWLIASTVIPHVSHSLLLLVPTLSVLLGIWMLGQLALSLAQSITLAVVSTRLYEPVAQSTERLDAVITAAQNAVADGSPAGSHASGRLSRIIRLRWVQVLAVLLLASLSAGGWLVSSISVPDRAIVIAHRGASAYAPENTMAAVLRAIDDQADLVEIDVQETADGEVVVFHDSDFMRLAGQRLKIRDATLAQLADIDVGSRFSDDFRSERVPTLAAVLAACKGKTRLNIELKYYGHNQQLEERVATRVEEAGMESQVVLMSLDPTGIARMKSLRPNWTVGLLASASLGDMTTLKADFLAINARFVTQDFLRSARARRKPVYAWTVDDPVTMSHLLTLGVDGLITNKPDVAREVIAQREDMSTGERLLVDAAARVGLLRRKLAAAGNEPPQ